jgi:hypothetical protein
MPLVASDGMSKRTVGAKAAGARRKAEPGRSSRKARQAAAARARRRNRTVAIAAVIGVLAVVAVMVIVAVTRSPGGGTTRSQSAGRAAELVRRVPTSVLAQVGAGEGVSAPAALPADTPPLESDGKVEVLYVGAEYCPYCAAERWPLVVALSRFGSFSDLGATESAADDVFPRTQTFTFHGATYRSDALAFASVETSTNQPDPAGGYTPLDEPTAQQRELLQRYDRQPYTSQPGAIPFLMIGNRYVSIGASYDPSVLQGMSREEIAAALSDPTSDVAKAVDGAANTLTAAICEATDGEPASVCSDPTIAKIAETLPTP